MEERKLINEDGRPNFGIFSKPLNVINIDDLRPYGNKKFSLVGKKMLKMFKIKRWQYMGVSNDEIVFGSAIVSTGYIGNMFLYLFDRKSKRMYEVNMIRPFARGINFDGSAEDGIVSFETRDCNLQYKVEASFITLTLRYKNMVSAYIRFSRIPEPLSLVVRDSLEGFNYTHKEAGMEIEGELMLNGERFTLRKENSFGVLDYTIGLLARETFWNWASGGGMLESGKRLGFNLSSGINETGQTENVFWIDGKMYKVDIVKFKYLDTDLTREWSISSCDGKINLVFTPEGLRKANINAIFIKSKFSQPFGRFTGCVEIDEERIGLKDVYGFTEEHFARW